ncbi:MAG: MopE-related protein, partial [Myxococcota bacterium]|nr:MopE-related protein [Myxococcota bacterium]
MVVLTALLLLQGCQPWWKLVEDYDGDGYSSAEDCNDADATIHPEKEEVWYDCIDQNCDGNDGDQDLDGYSPDVLFRSTGEELTNYVDPESEVYCDPSQFVAQVGTGDCWDDPDPNKVKSGFRPVSGQGHAQLTAIEVHPAAEDAPYDGVDQNCDGGGEFDVDGDGENSASHVDYDGNTGLDCDDTDPGVNTTAEEVWYNGIDENCDGNDDDQDGDSFPKGADCNDQDAAANPNSLQDA